jgi:hypothetical protein
MMDTTQLSGLILNNVLGVTIIKDFQKLHSNETFEKTSGK